MSEEPTWSQRKSWNNDGMDPDWRPRSEPRKSIGKDIDELVDAARAFADLPVHGGLENVAYEDWIQFKVPVERLRRLVNALEAIKPTHSPEEDAR